MDPVHIHLMLNHIPVLGTLFGIAIFLFGFFRKSEEVQRVSLYVFIFSAVIAIPVFLTGEPAEEAVEHLAGVSESLIETHEDMAKISLFLIEILGVSALVSLFISLKQQLLPKWSPILLLILSLGTGGMMSYTASLGGQIRHSEIRSGATVTSGEKDQEKEHGDTKDKSLNSSQTTDENKRNEEHERKEDNRSDKDDDKDKDKSLNSSQTTDENKRNEEHERKEDNRSDKDDD